MKTIKILLSIIFILLVSTSYGQNYNFDKIVKSSFSTQSFPNQEWTHFFNSKDDSYHMHIYKRNDSLVSRIFDTKENEEHYFHIDKSNSLNFIETKNLSKNINENKFEFSKIEERKGNKEITFKILNDRDKKIANYKFKIKETDEDFFSIFKLSALENQLFSKIKPSKHFIVLEAKGNSTKYKLDSIEDINLTVKIPE